MGDEEGRRGIQALVKATERLFLQKPGETIDYRQLAEDMLILSGAGFVALNIYEESGHQYQTVAIAGEGSIVEQASDLLGLRILGHRWRHDKVKEEKIKGGIVTLFPTLSALTGDILPKPAADLVSGLANIGAVAVAKIERNGRMIGDYTMFFPRGGHLANTEAVTLFALQTGFVVTRKRSEEGWAKSKEDLLDRDLWFRACFEQSPIASAYHQVVFDDKGKPTDIRILSMNKAFRAMLGSDRSGMLFSEVFRDRPAEREAWIADLGAVGKSGKKLRCQRYFPELDKWFEMVAYPFKAGFLVAKFVDISEQKKLEYELHQSRDLMRYVIEHMRGAVAVHDRDLNYIYVSRRYLADYNVKEQDVIGRHHYDVFPDLPEKWRKVHQRCLQGEILSAERDSFPRADGSVQWTRWECRPWYEEGGTIGGIIIYTEVITEQVEAELRLRESEERFSRLFERAPLGYQSLDAEGRILEVNEAWQEALGYKKEEVLGTWFGDLLAPEELESFRERFPRFVACGTTHVELRMRQRSGEYRHFAVDGRIGRKPDGAFDKTHCILTDITDRIKAQEQILFLSYRDPLTGLYNRRYYEEELRRLDTKRNLPITMVMADVNGLKLTNDAFGHQAGDRLLKKIASVLRKQCREDEILARIGGDEFIILLPNTDRQEGEQLVQRIQRAVEREAKKKSFLSASFGLATKTDPERDMREVFKEAEDDMYRHKLAESASLRSKAIDLILESLFEKNDREMHHSKRVSEICRSIAAALGLPKNDVEQMAIAGLMHDIGKIGIPDAVLNKPGGLSAEEWDELKRHSEIGYRILSSVVEFSEIAEFVLSHHERWDGNGYPQGLAGSEIPLMARVIALADAFDAMMSDRPYREGLSESAAIVELRECAGTQFDPDLAKLLVEQVLGKAW